MKFLTAGHHGSDEQISGLIEQIPQVKAGASSSPGDVMTSDDSLLLILRRLDEMERKLDCILEELQTPTAIGHSARRGSKFVQGSTRWPKRSKSLA